MDPTIEMPATATIDTKPEAHSVIQRQSNITLLAPRLKKPHSSPSTRVYIKPNRNSHHLISETAIVEVVQAQCAPSTSGVFLSCP